MNYIYLVISFMMISSYSLAVPRPTIISFSSGHKIKSSSATQCSSDPLNFTLKVNGEALNNQKKMEDYISKSKVKLSEIYSVNGCKYPPDKIQLKLIGNEKSDPSAKESCENELQVPNMPYKVFHMHFFREFSKTNLSTKLCSQPNLRFIMSPKSKMDLDQRPLTKKTYIDFQKGIYREIPSDNSATEARPACIECSFAETASKTTISGVIEQSRKINQRIGDANRCEPQGVDPTIDPSVLNMLVADGRMNEIIEKYSQRSKGAIMRAYLAMVKPGRESRAKELLNQYGEFKNIPMREFEQADLFHATSKHDCYRFIKAALSGDYSIIKSENRRANYSLLEEQCNVHQSIGTGDLALSHSDWRHNTENFSSLAAGNSGPELKKRGFINILDSQYGVRHQFLNGDGTVNERSLPDGAVIVYHCNDHTKEKRTYASQFSNPYTGGNPVGVGGPKCKYGDIALKDGRGFLREFYSETPPSLTGKRVVVGVYIKPSLN